MHTLTCMLVHPTVLCRDQGSQLLRHKIGWRVLWQDALVFWKLIILYRFLRSIKNAIMRSQPDSAILKNLARKT